MAVYYRNSLRIYYFHAEFRPFILTFPSDKSGTGTEIMLELGVKSEDKEL